MSIQIYCVVNTGGVPYWDTFRATEEDAWRAHLWSKVPKDGERPDSCKGETMNQWEALLKANGDVVRPAFPIHLLFT